MKRLTAGEALDIAADLLKSGAEHELQGLNPNAVMCYQAAQAYSTYALAATAVKGKVVVTVDGYVATSGGGI